MKEVEELKARMLASKARALLEQQQLARVFDKQFAEAARRPAAPETWGEEGERLRNSRFKFDFCESVK